ncbi:MAG: M16 family metallopeptidase [Mucilaginibacter sp.]
MNLNKKLYTATLALLVATCSFAQVKKKPATHKPAPSTASETKPSNSELLPIDPNVTVGKLPNGLTYYIRKNTEPRNRAVLYLVCKAGSVLETDAQQGLAHFTEHMAFNGTRDFPKNQLVDYLQKSGVRFGADLNASTTFDQTVYELPIPTDTTSVFEKGFNILANWAGYVSFDPTELDKERGVVLEEARLRGKNAQERLQQQVLPVLLNNSRYAVRLPIGKENIIKTASVATIKSFYHDWYRPDLQAVIAVGDFDPARVKALIEKNFSAFKNPKPEKPRTQYDDPFTPGTSFVSATDKEFPYTLAEIVVKQPQTPIRTTTDYMRSLRVSLFNQMLNARLGELQQRANPPFLYGQASYGNFIGRQNAFTTVAVAKSGADLQTAVKAVVAETERARKFGFTSTELERAKQNVLVQFENAYKEKDKTASSSYVQEYVQNFLNGEAIPGIDFEYNFYVSNLAKITVEEMNAMAGKFISDQNRVVIVEAPDKEKANLPDEKTILDWINTAGNNLKPYVDNVSTEPLINRNDIPRGSAVVNAKRDDSIGVATYLLSNGVKIIMKPTDFKNDQIIISGYAFGGTSLANDADFTSANLSASIVGSSGINDIDEIKLDKMLAGKNVSISPYITETTEGISGNCSPQDLETALQLIYLYFTKPRKDTSIWQSNIAQAKAYIQNRGLEPATVYRDTITAVLSQHNFRDMATTMNQLNSASLDKAYNFYKDRFADANGFTFTIVGNFNISDITPLLQTYLGGLPSTDSVRKETYRNLHIVPPAGQITKIVTKGVDDKANVQLVFSGDYDFSEQNNLQLDALEAILQIKLTERLREQDSGVYSPGVSSNYNKIPNSRYSFNVFFTCAPGNVDKLVADALDEINKIKQNGALQTDIDKFKSENIRSTEVELRQNYFWAGYLAGGSQSGQDPHRILNHIKDLNKVTVQSTKDFANKYLSGTNLIKFELLPEKAPAAAAAPAATAPASK